MRRLAVTALAFLAFGVSAPAGAGEAITGKARVLSGDTLVVNGKVIGLYGIAAPGPKQICLDAKGHDYSCGAISARALAAHLKDTSVTCQTRSTDSYGRTLAVCMKGKEDVSAAMAIEGHAVAIREGDAPYVKNETPAWGKRRGLWAGSFEDPTHRKRNTYTPANVVVEAHPQD